MQRGRIVAVHQLLCRVEASKDGFEQCIDVLVII